MKGKDRTKNMAVGETQVSDKPVKVVFTYAVVALLFVLLITSYFFVFCSKIYAPWGKYRLDGTFDASGYYGAKDYDLIVILPAEIKDLEKGDIVCYSSLERGSGKLIDIQKSYLALENEDGSVMHIGLNVIVGKQHKTVRALGFFLEFITSYWGIATFTILLIGYIAFITFRRINYENTEEGKRLYRKFVADRKAETERRLLLKKVERAGEIDVIVHSVIKGDFEQNKKALVEFSYGNASIKASIKDKYKFVLTEVYERLISKPELSRIDTREIGKVTELMFEAGEIDLDIEYMLIDLALKVNSLRLSEGMNESAKNYFDTPKSEEELGLVGAVLYVMIYKHGELLKRDFAEIVRFYLSAVGKIEDFQQKPVGLVAKSMKKMLKS